MSFDFQPFIADAVEWAKHQGYGRRWRFKLQQTHELPPGYEHLHEYPFGIPRWNARVKLLRYLLSQGEL